MRPIAVWLSISLHIVLLLTSYLNLGSLGSRYMMKDTGHAVFDFVTIGAKSKASVLSIRSARAGKNKTHNDLKQSNNQESSTSSQNSETEKNNQHENKTPKKNKTTDNKKTTDSVPPKKPDKEKNKSKPVKMPSKTTDKKPSLNKAKKPKKNANKALVNINDNKKKIVDNKHGLKGTFDSVIDSVLADGESENSGMNAEEIGDTLTATQIDLVRETIRPCWHFPAGLKDADQLIVDIEMELNEDGYVKSAVVTDKARMALDSGFRTAAESALRAVLDPECNPLPLPKDKYKEWKNLELRFNPKDWA